MSSNSFNFTDLTKAAEDAGFTVLAKGDYDVEVVTAEAKVTGTGKPQIAVKLKVIAGPSTGKTLFNNFVITKENANALGFFFRHMAAFGLPIDYFNTNPPLAQVASQLVGKRATVSVSIRQWQGTDRNQVDGVKPLNGAGALPGTGIPSALGALPGPGINPATGLGAFPPPMTMPTPVPAPITSVSPPANNVIAQPDGSHVSTPLPASLASEDDVPPPTMPAF